MNKYLKYSVSIAIINLVLLYFIKYTQNNLSLSDFCLMKTGNLISLIFTFFLVIGILFFSNRPVVKSIDHSKFVLLFSLIYLFPLVINILLVLTNFQFKTGFLFGYPYKKIIPVIFLLINQIMFLFVLVVIWYLAFGYSVKSYFYSSLLVAVLIFIFVFSSFLYTFSTNKIDLKGTNSKFDYGIILGAAVWKGNIPSPIFRGRIIKGAELYKSRVIKKIQLTGGNAPGEISEAKAAKNFLTKNYNISPEDILIEEKTSTTNEQLSFIKQKLVKLNVDKKFLIISDEFHLKRVQEMASFYDLNAQVISSDIELNIKKSLFYRFRDSIGLIFFWLFAI